MKKLLSTFSVLAFLILCCPNDATAQRGGGGSDFDSAIKVGPLGFLFGSYNATYEKKLGDKNSVVGGARFSSYGLGDTDYTSFSINGQYRMYFKEAITGPYLAPGVGFGTNSGSVMLAFQISELEQTLDGNGSLMPALFLI